MALNKSPCPNVVVLISGNGSNLQAIIDARDRGDLNINLQLVMSNKKSAYGLERADKAGIKQGYFPLKPFKDAGKSRDEYDAALAEKLKSEVTEGGIDLIVLAGWMHILSSHFLDCFPDKVINLHPALPGEFDGKDAIERAFTAYQANKITRTGVMVHKVIPEVDRGATILTQEVEIKKEDTLEDLETRIHGVEHGLLVKAIKKVLSC
eukprot:Nk52_evm2s967 gene=Nk52_evmTU2s967